MLMFLKLLISKFPKSIDVDNNTLVVDSNINRIVITLTLPGDATGTLA